MKTKLIKLNNNLIKIVNGDDVILINPHKIVSVAYDKGNDLLVINMLIEPALPMQGLKEVAQEILEYIESLDIY